MLEELKWLVHPQSVQLTSASPGDVTLCEPMKLRMFIRKVLNQKAWRKLLIIKIFKHLVSAFNNAHIGGGDKSMMHQLLSQIVALLKA